MSFANFPKGFSGGVNIQGFPLFVLAATSQSALTNTGKTGVYWVDNTNGLDGNNGTYTRPLKTLSRAIALCSPYDLIILKPGHAETISSSTALTLSVAHVTILGLGQGASRPTFTLDTATTARINVTAAGVNIQNCLFVANFADIATFFTLTTAKDFQLIGNEFRDTSSILNALTVVTTNSTANAADGLTFNGNKISSLGTTAATTAIKLGAAIDRFTVQGNYFNYAVLNNTATVVAGGANDMTNVDISKNIIIRPNTDTATGGLILTSSSTACTGMVYDNYMRCLDAAAIIIATTGTKLGFTNNLVSGAADASAFLLPAADTDA